MSAPSLHSFGHPRSLRLFLRDRSHYLLFVATSWFDIRAFDSNAAPQFQNAKTYFNGQTLLL